MLVLLHLPHLKSEVTETQAEEGWLGPAQRELCGCSPTACPALAAYVELAAL